MFDQSAKTYEHHSDFTTQNVYPVFEFDIVSSGESDTFIDIVADESDMFIVTSQDEDLVRESGSESKVDSVEAMVSRVAVDRIRVAVVQPEQDLDVVLGSVLDFRCGTHDHYRIVANADEYLIASQSNGQYY